MFCAQGCGVIRLSVASVLCQAVWIHPRLQSVASTGLESRDAVCWVYRPVLVQATVTVVGGLVAIIVEVGL